MLFLNSGYQEHGSPTSRLPLFSTKEAPRDIFLGRMLIFVLAFFPP